MAYGGVMPLYALVTREYFGERVLGTAYGIVFFISCIGMGLGSWAGGVIHDGARNVSMALPRIHRYRDHGGDLGHHVAHRLGFSPG